MIICLGVELMQFYSESQQLESRFTKLLQLVRYDTGTHQKQSNIKQLIANIKVSHLRTVL